MEDMGINIQKLEEIDLIVLKNVFRKVLAIDEEIGEVPGEIIGLSEFDGGHSNDMWFEQAAKEFEQKVHECSIEPEAEKIKQIELDFFTCGLEGKTQEVFNPILGEAYGW